MVSTSYVRLLAVIMALVAFAACPSGGTGGDTGVDVSMDIPIAPDAPDVASDTGADTVEGPGLGIDYSTAPSGASARFDLAADDWMAVGWPTDRLLVDGVPDLSSFPGWDMELLDQYLAYGMEVLDGWGTNGTIYLEFDGELDAATFPGPADTMSNPKALIQLVNVTQGSSRFGEQLPLQTKFYADGTDLYYHPKTLAVRAVLGFPLAPKETYCAIVTRGVKDAQGAYLGQSPAFAEALANDSMFEALNEWLAQSALLAEDLAMATCFTTSDPTKDLRTVRNYLEGLPTSQLTDIAYLGQAAVFHEFRGHYRAPNFQSGKKPYIEGGDIIFDDDGQPVVQLDEDVRFLLLIPTAYKMPPNGWPIVQYAHGTGGDYETCKFSAGPGLTMEGFAVICIDQPIHGERGPFKMGQCSDHAEAEGSLCDTCETADDCAGLNCTDLEGKGTFCTIGCLIPADCEDGFSCQLLEGAEAKQCVPQGPLLTDFELTLYSFNYLNPRSGRTSFLQSAIDTMNLTRMISAGGLNVEAGATDFAEPILFDEANIQLFGHSHGGLSGALVLGVDPMLSAGFLSGAGGGLLYTMLVREDPVNISELVTTVLEIKDKDFDIFHPALTLIQTLVEVTDPLNYAPYWLNPAPGGTSKHIFITEGTADHATAGLTTEAMAAAGGVHLVEPVVQESLAHTLKGWPTQPEPVFKNVVDSFGEKRTAGLRQWFKGDHWVALNDTIAEKLWRSWFRSIRKGYEPAITQD